LGDSRLPGRGVAPARSLGALASRPASRNPLADTATRLTPQRSSGQHRAARPIKAVAELALLGRGVLAGRTHRLWKRAAIARHQPGRSTAPDRRLEDALSAIDSVRLPGHAIATDCPIRCQTAAHRTTPDGFNRSAPQPAICARRAQRRDQMQLGQVDRADSRVCLSRIDQSFQSATDHRACKRWIRGRALAGREAIR
jgi:hypothetical protein